MAEMRAKKAVINLAKTAYYLVWSIWAYVLLKETNFMPPMLGGNGQLENCFSNVPFQDPVKGLLTYSLISLGYYLGDLFDTVLMNRKSEEYWEMLLHHVLTITLFGGMIMQN